MRTLHMLGATGLAALMAACVPVPIPASLEKVELDREDATKPIATGGTVVVLARAELVPSPDRLDCVIEAMRETAPGLPLVDAMDFRDRLFPWFEPGVLPVSRQELTETLARPDLQRALQETQVRHLVIVGALQHKEGEIFGPWGPKIMMPAGAGWAHETAEMAAGIWDLETRASLGNLGVTAAGESFVATWLASVVFIPRTQSKACSELGTQLALFLTGQELSEPDPSAAESSKPGSPRH